MKVGFGVFKTKGGIVYEGNFKNDEKDGLGKLVYENGQNYIGNS